MANILVRDLPEQVVAAIDANARRLGLSRNEYLKRQLAQGNVGAVGTETCTVDDLARFAETFADLADPEVMARAWS